MTESASILVRAARKLLSFRHSISLIRATREVPTALCDFLDARDWNESKRILSGHPELLSERIDALLDEMAKFYENILSKKGRSVQSVRAHQELLRRCRQSSIETAFEDKIGRKVRSLEDLVTAYCLAETDDECVAWLCDYSELLNPDVDRIIKSTVGVSLSEEANQTLSARQHLLRRAREIGVDRALAEHRWSARNLQSLISFLIIDEADESRSFVERHPELLSLEATEVLRDRIKRIRDPEKAWIASQAANLLDAIRSFGARRGYAQHVHNILRRRVEDRDTPNPEFDPVAYSQLQYDIGASLLEAGDPDQISEAIEALRLATRIEPPLQASDSFAKAHLALAHAYMAIADSSRAMQSWLKVIEHSDKITNPEIWGEAHYQLGVCYSSLPSDMNSVRQEESQYSAIQCFKCALAVSDPQMNAEGQVIILCALGRAYLRMPRDSIEEAHFHLSFAIRWYMQALEIGNQLAESQRFTAWSGLARAHSLWDGPDRDTHLQEAIDYCNKAIASLGIGKPKEASIPLLYLLGMIFKERAENGDEKSLQSAVSYMNDALDRSQQHSSYQSAIINTLGMMHFKSERWEMARSNFSRALELDSAHIEHDRQPFHQAEVGRNLAFCHYKLSMPELALQTLEKGRCQAIKSSLTRILALMDGSEAARSRYGQSLSALRDAQQELDELRVASGSLIGETQADSWLASVSIYDLQAPTGPAAALLAQQNVALADKLVDAMQAFTNVAEEVANEIPALRAMEGDFSALARTALSAEAAIVVPLVTSQGAVALVASCDQITAVPLPDLDEETLNDFVGWGSVPVLGNSSIDNVTESADGYLGAYFARFRSPGKWFTALEKTAAWLGTVFWEPIVARLPSSVQRLTVIPHGQLWLLPFHSALLTKSDGQIYLLERYSINYAPSISTLLHCQTLAEVVSEPRLSAFINPQEDKDLEWCWPEGEAIGTLFSQSKYWLGKEARREAALQMKPGATYVHVAAHGRFNWTDAKRSGLRMADTWLTASDMWSGKWDLQGVRLLTMSACETGIVDHDENDEYFGLPGAALLAGVPSVVGTLWPVDDVSTCLLMQRFYRNHLKQGLAIPDALKEAQMWLRQADSQEVIEICNSISSVAVDGRYRSRVRDLANTELSGREPDRPFAHPFYWAPFVVVGV
jgi:CHAT domain-containing protein/tetratricopeptide (TPR) repeat protein